MLVARGLSGFFSRRCRGLKPCLELVTECENSSPVLTWISGYFWSLPRGVSPRLEWGHARALSSRAVAAVSRFPSRESKQLWHSLRLSHEAFSRGFPTRLSHRAVPLATVVGVDLRVLLESLQGSQSSYRVGACTCAFLPRCSSSVTLPFA